MYRHTSQLQIDHQDFRFPQQLKLSSDNRWVILAQQIPWSEFEQQYAPIFEDKMGAPAKPFQMALAALIIKESLVLTDTEVVEQIKENPHLQYLIGLTCYEYKEPFHPSMLVHFRKRINPEIVNEINKKIVKNRLANESLSEEQNEESLKDEQVKNKGKLLLDATCTPADINYPTDLG